jgi:hypothetical protein
MGMDRTCCWSLFGTQERSNKGGPDDERECLGREPGEIAEAEGCDSLPFGSVDGSLPGLFGMR